MGGYDSIHFPPLPQQDIDWLSKQLGNLQSSVKIDWPEFNHLDFLWGMNSNRLLYDPLISVLPIPWALAGSFSDGLLSYQLFKKKIKSCHPSCISFLLQLLGTNLWRQTSDATLWHRNLDSPSFFFKRERGASVKAHVRQSTSCQDLARASVKGYTLIVWLPQHIRQVCMNDVLKRPTTHFTVSLRSSVLLRGMTI